MTEAISQIQRIQEEYLRIVREAFGRQFDSGYQHAQNSEEMAIRSVQSESQIAVSYSGSHLTGIEYRLHQLALALRRFWDANSSQLLEAVRNSGLSLVNVETVEILPYVCKYGVYFDTLCVPCPISRSLSDLITESDDPHRKITLRVQLLRACYEILRADHNGLFTFVPPILMFYPSTQNLSVIEADRMLKSREAKLETQHESLGRMYHFYLDQLWEYCFDSPAEYEGTMELMTKLYFDPPKQSSSQRIMSLVDEKYTLERLRLIYGLRSSLGYVEGGGTSERASILFFGLCILLSEVLTFKLDCIPLGIEFCLFSGYERLYKWMLSTQLDHSIGALGLCKDEVALYSLQTQFDWLCDLSLDTVKSIRNSGGNLRIKHAFRDCFSVPTQTKIEDLDAVAKQIKNQILVSMAESYAKIGVRRKEMRLKVGKEVGIFTVNGTLSILGLIYSSFGPFSAVLSAMAGASLVDVVRTLIEGRSKVAIAEREPLAILASAYPGVHLQKAD